MSFLGLMTVRAHEAVVAAKAKDHAEDTARWGILMKQGGDRIRELQDELATLRADAQKWRDRKQADREYRAAKRAKAVRLEAAEPPHR